VPRCRALLLGQIVRVEVLRGGRVLAQAGAGPAIAPLHAARSRARPRPSSCRCQAEETYLQVVHQVTGAPVLLLAGTRRLAGTIGGPPPASMPSEGPLSYAGQSYQTVTLAGAVYPSGPLRIAAARAYR
jgi:hypothetical protein